MNIAKAAFGISLLLTGCSDSHAAEGDTNIYVHYKTKAVRVRPSFRAGTALVDFRIVLHANGTVDDVFAVKDGQKGATKNRLGVNPKNVAYKVIDASTITRATDLGTHFHKLTVRVSGKNCTAAVDFVLKPGRAEYKDYSTELKTMAYYSKLETEYVTCVIE